MDRVFNYMDRMIMAYEQELQEKELHIIAIATVFYMILAVITFINFIF